MRLANGLEHANRLDLLRYGYWYREAVLSYGSFAERRTSLRSFVRSVEREEGRVTFHYTLPLPSEDVWADLVPVLVSIYSVELEGLQL